MSFGLRAKDPGSGSDKLHRGRLISTYYHEARHAGEALLHLRKISEGVAKATDVEPHQIVIRLRSSAGDEQVLREVIGETQRMVGGEGLSSRHRVARNSDGSFDAEISIATDDDFDRALLAIGDVIDLPREV